MTALAALALLGWLWLALAHGRFWQSGPLLSPSGPTAARVVAVVPARNEAALIGRCVRSLLEQDHASLRVIVVDDGSTDDTAGIARALAGRHALTVLRGAPTPAGWAGKVWAMQQGLVATDADAEYVLLTDADILHDPAHVETLVAWAEAAGVDMVSEMVALRHESLPERALVPAFVYFFALLFPFAQVNDGLSDTAAAAGGTMLVRRRALDRIGGFAAIRGARIDDVALATRIKVGGRIWIGHSGLARSLRAYPRVADIWRMVTRSAYAQLRNSPPLLVATALGLALLFVVPPAAALLRHHWARAFGVAAWLVMAATFLPTLRRFRATPLWAPLLPVIALVYLAATIASAAAHHRGHDIVWRGRRAAEAT